MEVLCIEGFERASFSGPQNLRPENYPKRGEIYNVVNIHKIRGRVFYYLKEFGNDVVFDSESFVNIDNLNTEIEKSLARPNSSRRLCRPSKTFIDSKIQIITTPLGCPDWIKRFNDL